jgi:hypothetical protein
MVYYKMKTEIIVYCVVAIILGMLMANMLKDVCGCNSVVEGQNAQHIVGDVDSCGHDNNKCGNTVSRGSYPSECGRPTNLRALLQDHPRAHCSYTDSQWTYEGCQAGTTPANLVSDNSCLLVGDTDNPVQWEYPSDSCPETIKFPLPHNSCKKSLPCDTARTYSLPCLKL